MTRRPATEDGGGNQELRAERRGVSVRCYQGRAVSVSVSVSVNARRGRDGRDIRRAPGIRRCQEASIRKPHNKQNLAAGMEEE